MVIVIDISQKNTPNKCIKFSIGIFQLPVLSTIVESFSLKLPVTKITSALTNNNSAVVYCK